MINLLISWYSENDPVRKSELLKCLNNNISNTSISSIICLLEGPEPPVVSPKIKYIHIDHRPTYNDFFRLATDDINVLCNSDIYFDATISLVENITDRDFLCLTRWDVVKVCQDGNIMIPNGHKIFKEGRGDSQDVWIWRGKTSLSCDFCLGMPGCDNRLAHEASLFYNISNPSLSIKPYHEHSSDDRTYTRSMAIPPPYKYLKATSLKPIRFLNVHLNYDRVQAYCNSFEKMCDKIGAEYREFDWLRSEKDKGNRVSLELLSYCNEYLPTHMFMQIQRANVIRPFHMQKIASYCKIMNWSGDVRVPLPSWYPMIGKNIHTTCFTDLWSVDEMRKQGCRSDFMGIGFDPEMFDPEIQPIKSAEIVFLGNNYGTTFELSQYRKEMCEHLSSRYGYKFKVYGSCGKESIKGKAECGVYRGAKIAINCSQINLPNYSSDRLQRIMASGTFCLSKKFKENNLFKEGVEGEIFETYEELNEKIDYYLLHTEAREKIAKAGYEKAWRDWTWDAIVENQFRKLMEI